MFVALAFLLLSEGIVIGRAYHVSQPQPAPRLLVIFRPPSRNTFGFSCPPSGQAYDLPELELDVALRRRSSAPFSFAEAAGDAPSSFKWLLGLDEMVGGEEMASDVVSRCILTFGLYKVYAWGPDHSSTLRLLEGSRDLVRKEMAQGDGGGRYGMGVTRRCDRLPKSQMEMLTRGYRRALRFIGDDIGGHIHSSAGAPSDKARLVVSQPWQVILDDDEDTGAIVR